MALEFKLVKTEEELHQALKIRYQFSKEDYLPEAEREETDEFDYLPVTTHFLALRDGKIVGTLRLIEDSEKGLPIQEFADLSPYRKEGHKLAKASKLFILPEGRGGGKTMLGLFKITYLLAKRKGITDLYITSNAEVAPIFEKLFFKQIGEPKFYDKFKVRVVPMHLDLTQALKKFGKEKSRLAAYLSEEEDKNIHL